MRRLIPALLVLALAGASLAVGAASLASGDHGAGWLLAVSRVPRTLAALLAGAGLALAGVVVQQAVQNRMVEPALTGTPEGAMLGLLAITMLAPGAALGWKMAAAAVAAMACTAGFLALAQRVPRQDPLLLPIVGLIFGGILGAVATWAAWATDLMQYLGTWQLGEFSGVVRGRYELLWLVALLALALYLAADRITLLGLGETQVRSLGLDYARTRTLGLAMVSALTAVVVVTVGALPFVGLVVPNLVSRWYGDNLRANLPAVSLGGGGAVLACDLAGRLIRHPFEIPAATIFAVAGAGVFLWLLHAAPRPAGRG
jgi:iron complex transport system permease protein